MPLTPSHTLQPHMLTDACNKFVQRCLRYPQLRKCILKIAVATDALPNWYANLSPTDTSVAAVLASGFPYSVYPCLRVFHETPTMQVAAPTWLLR
jgi:hypothetical protein